MPISLIREKKQSYGSTCLELHLEDREEEALPLAPVLLPARNVITGYTAHLVNAWALEKSI